MVKRAENGAFGLTLNFHDGAKSFFEDGYIEDGCIRDWGINSGTLSSRKIIPTQIIHTFC